MATIKNDRDAALQNRGVNARIMNPVVTVAVTSTGPTGTPYFTFADNSTTSLTPASITLTATATTAGSYNAPSYVWYYSTQMDPTTWVAISGATASAYTVAAATFRTQLSTGANVNYKVVVSQAGWTTTSVITSIDGYKNVNSPPQISISKENILLPSTNSIIDYSSSSTDILVSLAGTNIPYDATNALANTFTVAVTSVGTPSIAVGTASTVTTTVANDTRRFGTLSGISSSTGTALVIYTITVRDVNGKVYTYTKNQNISVAVQGQSAKTLSITSDSLIFARDASNAIVNPSFIKLTANKQNTVNTVTWATSPAVNLYNASTGGAITTTGDVVYMRKADYSTNTYVTVTASIAADSLTDTTAIASVKAGSLALQAVLSNYSAPLPTTTAGVVTYTGSGTTIQVYEGTTLCTITGVTATGTNITPGTVSGTGTTTVTVADHTAATANNGSIKYALTVTRGDGTSDSSISITQAAYKSLQGATGGTGTSGNSIYSATVYLQSASVPATPSATASSYNFSTNVLTPPVGWSVSQPATTTTPTYACDYTFVGAAGSTVTGVGSWSAPYVEAVAGSSGSSGEYRDVIQLYLQSATVPTKPTSVLYTFTGNVIGTITGGTAGWSSTMPASSTTPTYLITCPAATQTPSNAVTLTGWSTPAVVAQNGSNGATGNSIYTATVYVQSASVPATPSATASGFNFSTSVLTPPAGWLVSQPATTTTPTYASNYTFSGAPGSTVVGVGSWSAPYVEAVAGSSGSSGEYRDVIQLYLQSATVPTKPTSVLYTFTGSVVANITGGTAGWSTTLPATTTTPTYITNCPASTTVPGTAVTLTGWSAPAIFAQNGLGGSNGTDGNKVITISAFQWATSPPATVAATPVNYTWSTGAVSAYPSGYTASASSPTLNGSTLYQINLTLTTSASGAVSYGDWVNSIRSSVGYRADGSIGGTGQAARSAYIVTTTATVPGAVTAGSGDVAPTNAVANSVGGWNYTATGTLAAGQYMYRVDGLYTNGGNVTWGNPYLSNLKVGSLSALAADLGTVSMSTVGSLYSAGKTYGDNVNGVFLGYSGTAYKFQVGANNGPGISWDGGTFSVRGTGGTNLITSGTAVSDIFNSAITVSGRNILTKANILANGATVATGYDGLQNAFQVALGAGFNYRISNWTTHDVGSYSISFWAKASVATSMTIDLCDQVPQTTSLTTAWQYFKYENLTVDSTYLSTIYFGFLDFNPVNACTLYVSNVMLEYSNKASAWTPAPEDTQNANITVNSNGTLSGAGSGQVTLPGMGQNTYRVSSNGGSATATGGSATGLYINGSGTSFSAGARSYTVVKILRSTGAATLVGNYDVYGNATNAGIMATALNAIASDHIVVVYTLDEPQANRLTNGLNTAMYRHGASRGVFGSANFQYRSAYILVGIGGCGEGNGAEMYQGEISADPNAWCDLGFVLNNGVLSGVSTTSAPRTLTDYGYTGALNANATYVDANGQIQGVTAGGGTVIANSAITVTGGSITGIGTGANTVVANSAITVTNGSITGIGTGANTMVANSAVSINSNGTLTGAGSGQVSITGLGYLGALDATNGKSLAIPFSSWTLGSQTLVNVADGKVGPQVLRLAGNFGHPNMGKYVPIDYTKTYRTRFWARPSATNTVGLLYFSLMQYTNNTGTTGPVNGGRSPYKPSGVSPTTHNTQFGAQAWGEYNYTWTSADWQAGVTHVRPDFLDNYSGAAGYWEIQDFTFEEVTEVVTAATTAVWSGVSGTNKPADNANNTYIDSNGAIQGVSSGASTAVSNALVNTVSLVAATNTTVSGSTAWKSAGVNNTWDAQVYSKDSYTGGAYASFVPAQNNAWIMMGLNIDPTTDASYGSIDYAWYMVGDGNLLVYESGANPALAVAQTYAAGDVLAITYDGTTVSYLKNGTVCRTVTVSIASPIFLDSSFYTVGSKMTSIQFGPMTNAGSKLSKGAADTLTGPISLNAANAILVGTTSDGLYLGNTGIVGKKGGATTFAVDNAGNASFSGTINTVSATSGARMEIKNNVIKVFDANGILRVQLGDLAA